MGKICSRCGVEKEFSAFGKHSGNKDGLQYWCKDCKKEYEQEKSDRNREEYLEVRKSYYYAHREEINAIRRERYNNDPNYKAKQREANKKSHEKYISKRHTNEKRYRDAVRDHILDDLTKPCIKCGEDRVWLIQFHHVNPKEKLLQIHAAKTIESANEEVKKCVCLCANCHAEYHYFFGRKNMVNPSETLQQYLSGEFDVNDAYIRKRTEVNCGSSN
jgi:hypothetical protein